jgi:uncharacterized protein (DUF2252 family)
MVAERASPEDRAAQGRSLRSQAPRSGQATLDLGADRPDPIGLLEEEAAHRLPDLLPIRYGRMAASPWGFFRGAAGVMASDLVNTQVSGLRVQLCGDAHLANFGVFASPERDLLFDLNDFDETLAGPWEWDVKRLAASIAVAGRDNGFSHKQRAAVIREAVSRYRTAMTEFASMSNLAIWYARASVDEVGKLLRTQGSASQRRGFDKALAKGRRKNNARAFAKLAVTDRDQPRIRAEPPLIVPIDELVDKTEAANSHRSARQLFEGYISSLPSERRRLLSRYRYADLARKVVGVGSVGTSCWVALFLGRDVEDPLFLQGKEATRSVLEPGAGRSPFRNQGKRVVEGQRLMQAASDIFLGWLRAPREVAKGEPTDFYVRQLWDAKTSVDIDAMRPKSMTLYASLCAWTLARAHARSGDPIAIAGYLGSSKLFDRAIATFAESYAEQNERDYSALLEAIASGRISAETGV